MEKRRKTQGCGRCVKPNPHYFPIFSGKCGRVCSLCAGLDPAALSIHSAYMNAEEQAARRREIMNRLEAGETQAEIARSLGVTRQAIHAMEKQYKQMGEAFFEVRQRGRSKERDTLTEAEKAKVHAYIQDHRPAEVGREEDFWSLGAVKRAVLELTAKRVNLERAYEVLHYGDSRQPDEEPAAGATAALQAVNGAGQALPEADREDAGLPSLEEMQRLNEETWKSIPWETPVSGGPGYGQRVGKHAKGKGSPTQKKKKRKKR